VKTMKGRLEWGFKIIYNELSCGITLPLTCLPPFSPKPTTPRVITHE
jgi:hypothetical protein